MNYVVYFSMTYNKKKVKVMLNIKTYGGEKKRILQELELLGEILTNWVYQSCIDILVILQLLYQMQEINKLSMKKAYLDY